MKSVKRKVDHVVIGSDVVPSPMPRECLALLRGLEIPVLSILGNGESTVFEESVGADPGVPEAVREVIRWTARQLSESDLEYLASWPATLELEVSELGGFS